MIPTTYAYKINDQDLTWIKEAILTSNGNLVEYDWITRRKEDMYIVLHTSGYIEATVRPYKKSCVYLDTADEFKEKMYEKMLTR